MADWKLNEPLVCSVYQDGCMLQDVVQEALESDGDICGYRFCGEMLNAEGGKVLEFSQCIFEHCTFHAVDVGRLSFVDCVFIKCEMSNLRLVNAVFQRVRLQDCRMTGMECLRTMLMSVTFENCMLDYFSLSETKLDRVCFTGCRMRESLWSDVKMPKLRLQQTDLTRAQWMRTPLVGVDLSTCSIGGWEISLFDLRGARVTAAQVIELSGLLGVEIVP